ncbi:conserved hypothetical protein [Treponema primitia ZAS-2]|uniref:BrnT family toxin n=1 Tax=Treponema primitia (strain ATCC BAA-887 / DSM 12427 / ZAS-2) TaxID=545694 RepID=F5YQ08_TREPZ|nr:BrnT family toxin [Treponema primitia]AEF83730.1 conserved hypothetical protein [Treponema primitia ZAS-2]
MNFEWDSEKDVKNVKIHKLSFSTAKLVFNDPERMERFDRNHSDHEARYQTLGMVDEVLFVVYTERDDITRIISARLADKDERRIYYGNSKGDFAGWTKAD